MNDKPAALSSNQCCTCPDCQANERWLADKREIERLREALDSIRVYGSDTLSGRIDGPDDREWQRESVLEMTKRAREALAGEPPSYLASEEFNGVLDKG